MPRGGGGGGRGAPGHLQSVRMLQQVPWQRYFSAGLLLVNNSSYVYRTLTTC